MRTLFCLFFALMAFAPAQAQKVKKEKISFNYLRLPLTPLSPEVQTISAEVKADYVAQYEQDKAQAIANFEAEMEAWTTEVAAVENKNQAAQEAYDEKSRKDKFLDKLLLDEGGKPTKEYASPKPVLKEPVFLGDVVNAKALADRYLVINGYNKVEAEGDVQIIATLAGMECNVPIVEKKSKTVKNKDGSTRTVVEYFRKIEYRNPISHIVKDKNGTIIFTGALEASNTYKINSKKVNYSAVPHNWEEAFKDELAALDRASIDANMALIAESLDNQFAASEQEHSTELYIVDGKKFDYSDVATAYEHAMMAYLEMSNTEDFATHKENIMTAAEVWNAVIAEYDPDAKKARVDGKVAAAMRVNLIEGLCWAKEFSKAKMQVTKLKLMNIKKYEKMVTDLKAMIDDHEARHKANS